MNIFGTREKYTLPLLPSSKLGKRHRSSTSLSSDGSFSSSTWWYLNDNTKYQRFDDSPSSTSSALVGDSDTSSSVENIIDNEFSDTPKLIESHANNIPCTNRKNPDTKMGAQKRLKFIGNALSSTIFTADIIASPPVIHPRMEDPEIARYEDLLKNCRFELINRFGLQRANNIFKIHVKKFHFLIINANEPDDDAMASFIKKVLEDRPDSPQVKHRRDVKLGANRLAAWEDLIKSATTVLVLISRALFRDRILSITFPEALIDNRAVIPLFLEDFTKGEIEREFPSNLKPLLMKHGSALHNKDRESIIRYVDLIHNSFDSKRHYTQQIKAIQDILENHDVDFICPCGRC